MDLAQARHAFITGGASGIGLGIAQALADRGLAITIADIDRETMEQVVAAHGDKWRGQHLDTRDRAGWQTAKAEAEAAFGPVDVLVNNAGIAPNGQTFAHMDPASFDLIVAINLVGVFNGVSAFAADMAERGRGHIVNTSSQAGLTASMPGVGAYTAAKFGVTGMTENLRVELAPEGVGVSLLCPGYVVTNLSANTAKISPSAREFAPGAMPQSSVTPAAVGEMVVAAIEANGPYVITHPGVWKSMAGRFEALHSACAQREEAVAS
jgi:NAD(P)-dependent dehydrogenase (short-subunit alcohol dehydrogenase family)